MGKVGSKMSSLYALVLLIAIPATVWKLLDGIKPLYRWLVSVIAYFVIYGVGTYRACANGWRSPSIGSRGACSHNGGVTTFLNEIGYAGLAIGILLLVYHYYCLHKDNKKQSNLNSPTKEESFSKNNEVLIKENQPSHRHAAPAPAPAHPTFGQYGKYIKGWSLNGLTDEEIAKHLESKGIYTSLEEIREYLSN